ncbi:hypothetical protein [Mesorhizobium sp.]|uniref:hypothetical protein n=1 Tax=Mesorhizobium sp. TaxID=1871066 RepID=UPI00257D4DD4|nr:hypothetical protein [Mesorhizobium sp.]
MMVTVSSPSEARTPFTNDTASRTQALALLEMLNADLLSHPSATLTLERWCGDHGLALEAKIVAHRVKDDDKLLPDNTRQALGISADEPVHYRRVQLACGELVLSEADNWYVPSRLTPQMNRVLDTNRPALREGGPAAARPLAPSCCGRRCPKGGRWTRRCRRRGRGRWPSPRGAAAPGHPLYTGANQPFSLVVETYTAEVLAFGRR